MLSHIHRRRNYLHPCETKHTTTAPTSKYYMRGVALHAVTGCMMNVQNLNAAQEHNSQTLQ